GCAYEQVAPPLGALMCELPNLLFPLVLESTLELLLPLPPGNPGGEESGRRSDAAAAQRDRDRLPPGEFHGANDRTAPARPSEPGRRLAWERDHLRRPLARARSRARR